MNKPLSYRSNLPAGAVLVLSLLATEALRADSLWTQGVATSMFADKKATRVGDILTIIVQENNSTAKDSSTQTSKKTGVDASISSFLFPATASGALTKKGSLPAMKMQSSTDFNGGGGVKNSETVTARVAVRVIDVLPNKNLVVEGSRQTSYSGETQDIVLRGVVRPEDITPANSVLSYNVADVSIKFVNKGGVTDSTKKGWFTRVFDKISPF
jgi:flagellar L-ring protein precursor FlgH